MLPEYGQPERRGIFLFKRRKPEESQPNTQAPSTVQQGSARPAGTSGAVLSPNAGVQGGSVSGTPVSRSDNLKETSPMGRVPLPSGSSLPAGGGIPPMPGAATRGLPSQIQPKKEGPEQRTLVVGRGISVQGTVQDAERLVVEGTVESSMITAKELVVMPGGLFRGGVEVENAEIAGTVDGALTARGGLTVRGSGRLLGKAACHRLKVEDGGQITGQLEMLSEGSASAKTADSSAEPAKAIEG
ncbi:MAG: polymer-forming cytoskeletal protein [Acetobacter sp.]